MLPARGFRSCSSIAWRIPRFSRGRPLPLKTLGDHAAHEDSVKRQRGLYGKRKTINEIRDTLGSEAAKPVLIGLGLVREVPQETPKGLEYGSTTLLALPPPVEHSILKVVAPSNAGSECTKAKHLAPSAGSPTKGQDALRANGANAGDVSRQLRVMTDRAETGSQLLAAPGVMDAAHSHFNRFAAVARVVAEDQPGILVVTFRSTSGVRRAVQSHRSARVVHGIGTVTSAQAAC